MHVEGITWHAIVLEADEFAATKKLLVETFGLTPAIEQEGWALFRRRTAPSSTSSSPPQDASSSNGPRQVTTAAASIRWIHVRAFIPT